MKPRPDDVTHVFWRGSVDRWWDELRKLIMVTNLWDEFFEVLDPLFDRSKRFRIIGIRDAMQFYDLLVLYKFSDMTPIEALAALRRHPDLAGYF